MKKTEDKKETVKESTITLNTKRDLLPVKILSVMLAIFIIASGVTSYLYYLEYNKEPVVVEVEKKKEVEVVKYVEKSKTPTADFLMYLNPHLDPELAQIIANSVDKASEKYLLPRKLIVSIMRKESNIDPFARSNAGAVGLMQVMPKIHADKIGDRNIWHIETNIDVGCQIWRTYFDKEKGNIERTFHSYLSKNAAKSFAQKYQSDIEGFWAMLEMYDYLSTIEREKMKEENVAEEVKEEEVSIPPKEDIPLNHQERH